MGFSYLQSPSFLWDKFFGLWLPATLKIDFSPSPIIRVEQKKSKLVRHVLLQTISCEEKNAYTNFPRESHQTEEEKFSAQFKQTVSYGFTHSCCLCHVTAKGEKENHWTFFILTLNVRNATRSLSAESVCFSFTAHDEHFSFNFIKITELILLF